MVRVLVVQQLFNLKDEQMEFQLLDRLGEQSKPDYIAKICRHYPSNAAAKKYTITMLDTLLGTTAVT
jgi:hypothetical protein